MLVQDPLINPFLTNGLSHHYCLGESTFGFRCFRSDFYSVFDGISLCKQNSPRWDAAFCGITSGAILFAYVPLKRTPGLNELIKLLMTRQAVVIK